MEESLKATKLELWCEETWRELGYEPAILRREYAYTDYKVDGETFQVPLVPVQGSKQFKKDFLEHWEGRR